MTKGDFQTKVENKEVENMITSLCLPCIRSSIEKKQNKIKNEMIVDLNSEKCHQFHGTPMKRNTTGYKSDGKFMCFSYAEALIIVTATK